MNSYNSLFQTCKAVFAHLPKNRNRQFWLLLLAMIVVAVFETISLGVVALFASAITDPGAAINSGYMIWVENNFSWPFLNESRSLIIFLALMVIVIIPLKNIARGFMMYWINRYSGTIEAFFGEKLLNGFLSKDYQWLLNKNTADLILGIDWRVYIGRQFIASALNALSDIVVVFFLIGALLIAKPEISSFVLMVVGGAAYFIYFTVRAKIDFTAKKCAEFLSRINRICTKAIHGAKDVKISGTKGSFVKEFKNAAIPFARYFAWQQFLNQTPTLILESIGFIMLAGVVCIMVIFMKSSLASVTGTIALFAVTAWRVLPAINRIVKSLTTFRNALPFIATELDYLDQVELKNGEGLNEEIESVISYNKRVELKNIIFRYEGTNEPVIKNLSLIIEKGETVGVVGFSGAGKSTVVDILCGLLSPEDGFVSVDGNKLNKSEIFAWGKKLGYVSQSPYIFDGTIAQNIAFGMPDKRIDKDRVLECCKMAAIDFLDESKGGLNTYIGERGVRLSGGQQQRVAIARALYRNPNVLIFDEATSALDSKSEKAILKTIYGLKGTLTLIIVAHRLSTLRKCDRIVWIEKGGVKEMDVPEKILLKYKEEMMFESNRSLDRIESKSIFI